MKKYEILNLADKLKDLRNKHNRTQKQTAELLAIKEEQYQKYELNTQTPGIGVLINLAKLYKVSIDYLVGLTDDPTPFSGKE